MKTSAIDARYKNNLLNVELTQTPDNRVSVLLVFEKPYTEPVKVIYKTDNEYNILLPETYHSITSVSTLNALNIRSANVKLVPYFNQDNSNGYTKITLQTTRPVVFNAHASYITTQLAQNDLIDKIEQNEEFKIQPTKVVMDTRSVKKVAKPVKSKPVATKAVSKATTQKTTSKPAVKPVQTVKPKEVIAQTSVKDIAKVEPPIVEQEQILNTVETLEKEQIQPVEQITTVEKPNIVEPVLPTVKDNVAKNTNFENFLANKDNQSVFVIIGALLLLFVLLARVSRKKAVAQQERTIIPPRFAYEEEEVQTQQEDIPQEIKDLSWQEKYKFVKEKGVSSVNNPESQENAIANMQQELISKAISNAVDNYNRKAVQEEYETIEVDENSVSDIQNYEQTVDNENEQPKDDVYDPFGLNKPPINEGFEPAVSHEVEQTIDYAELEGLNDISDIEPSVDIVFEKAPNKEEIEEYHAPVEEKIVTATNPMEPTLINHTKISKTKGFYLVRYADSVVLTGYIDEQIFVLHTFNKKQPSFVQTRLTEKQKGADVYLVRTDDYKSLIKVTKNSMQTLLNL